MKGFFGKFSAISRDPEIFTVPRIVCRSNEKISVGIYPIVVGDTWYSPYCLLALYSTQFDHQSATGTMNACASANDSRRVFAENHSSWEGQCGGWFPDLNPQKSCKIFKNSCRIQKKP